MAMSALDASSCLLGPVPYKDVGEHGEMTISPPVEYADIVSTLPSMVAGEVLLRRYQGVWLIEWMVPGIISIQRRLVPRPGDVLIASLPKCGTTWVMALSFATMARAVYPPADAGHPLRRLNPHECVPYIEDVFSAGQEAKLEGLPSPRLLHTHMHHSMLPCSIAANPDGKIVYVCREPKDMLVSMWYFLRRAGAGNIPFSYLLELACQGQDAFGPIWEHVLGYWAASRDCPDRVLFLRYEEMLANPVSTVRELAQFLGVPFTAAEEAAGSPVAIAKLCSIDTMRGLDVNKTGKVGLLAEFSHESFFRKGVVGDWANHMTPEMARRIDTIMEDKLRGSGLTFTPGPTQQVTTTA